VGRPLELRFPLQVTLTAYLGLSSLIEKNGFISDLGELVLVARLFHYRMAVNASDPTARVGACFPVSLDAALMASETDFVLSLGRLSRVLTEADQPPNASPATGSDMVASRPVAALAGLPLLFVARVEEKDLPHHRLREFLELRRVTGFADFVADIGCRARLRSGRFRGPNDLR
jgi:hypothetical protein